MNAPEALSLANNSDGVISENTESLVAGPQPTELTRPLAARQPGGDESRGGLTAEKSHAAPMEQRISTE
jgi:hypothetical protein